MHQWESLQKLVHEWESQEVQDPYVYQSFKYNLEEWDNVPPVIPRFVFYIQNVISKDIEFSKEVYERQSTHSLREEINGYLADHMAKIKAEEASRMLDIKNATKRKDNIQGQVDDLKNVNKTFNDTNRKKAAEDLTGEAFLKMHRNFRQKDSEQKEPTYEDDMGLIDWNDKSLNEPRTLSIKNVRDIMFGILNQSKAQRRIVTSEDNITDLFKKSRELNDYCDRLDAKIDKTRQELDKQHNDFFDTFTATKEKFEEIFDKNKKQLHVHHGKLEEHQKFLE